MFKTVRRSLTKEQRERGVIYSSELKVLNNDDIEDDLKEVFETDANKERTIRLLKDVSFFKSMAEDFGYNVLHIVRC